MLEKINEPEEKPKTPEQGKGKGKGEGPTPTPQPQPTPTKKGGNNGGNNGGNGSGTPTGTPTGSQDVEIPAELIDILQAIEPDNQTIKLLETKIKFAKENAFEVIDLQVRSDNLKAIHLYEKYGFQKIGVHPAFFKINGEDISFDYMCLKIQ